MPWRSVQRWGNRIGMDNITCNAAWSACEEVAGERRAWAGLRPPARLYGSQRWPQSPYAKPGVMSKPQDLGEVLAPASRRRHVAGRDPAPGRRTYAYGEATHLRGGPSSVAALSCPPERAALQHPRRTHLHGNDLLRACSEVDEMLLAHLGAVAMTHLAVAPGGRSSRRI